MFYKITPRNKYHEYTRVQKFNGIIPQGNGMDKNAKGRFTL